ncbi:hypothetical protein [Saccharopolyspora sp. NPDC049357]|uniref:hypothetical protein n=1 Tax=Saccharopolyspora sp. NPDC049357 TaxID=3154507 RepID=UPI0034155B9B
MITSAVAGALLFLIARRGLGDDAYITVVYARNLAFSGHWGIIPTQTANTATSPLQVWLLALLTAGTGAPVMAVGLLLVITTAASGFWLHRIAGLTGLPRRVLPLLGVALLVSNPLLASTVGMETYLGIALLIALVRHALPGNWVATGVVAGAMILTRPDFAIIDLAVVLTISLSRRRALRSALVALAIALPWHVVSWFALGSALPDTLLTRMDESWGTTYATGLAWYFQHWSAATGVTVLLLLSGLAAACWAWSVRAKRAGPAQATLGFAAGGAAHAMAFALLAPPPAHWYYGPAVAGFGLASAVAVSALVRQRGSVVLGVATLPVLGALCVDLGHGLPWTTAPINGNWATAAQYQRMAETISAERPGSTIVSPAEVGTLSYFCECRIVDDLSDPGRTAEHISEQLDRAGPVTRALLSINYLHRAPAEPIPAEHRMEWENQPVDGPDQWPAQLPTDPDAQVRMRLVPFHAP